MKFITSSLSLLSLASLTLASPLTGRERAPNDHIRSPDDPQPDCAYPIGRFGGANAKVAGRLFDIDGRVQYFAGSNAWWLAHLSKNSDVDIALKEVAAVSSPPFLSSVIHSIFPVPRNVWRHAHTHTPKGIEP